MVVAAAPAALSLPFRSDIAGRGIRVLGRISTADLSHAKNAKNAKEKVCDGFSVPSLEKFSSATEFRPLCVLRVLRVLRVVV